MRFMRHVTIRQVEFSIGKFATKNSDTRVLRLVNLSPGFRIRDDIKKLTALAPRILMFCLKFFKATFDSRLWFGHH